MSQSRSLTLVILGILLLLGVLWVVNRDDNIKYNWIESYLEDSKEPFGTYICYELLKKKQPNLKIIKESVANALTTDSIHEQSNYVFVGQALYLDSLDTQTLLQFVEDGNTAFLSSKTIPFDLMFHLFKYEECFDTWNDYSIHKDSSIMVNFYDTETSLLDTADFLYKHMHEHEVKEYEWNYMDYSHFCDDNQNTTLLGAYSFGDTLEYINFIKVTYGKGLVYLHTTPLTLTNIQMLDEVGLDYASQLFTHLNEGNILWDAYGRQSEGFGRRRNQQGSFSSGGGGDNQLTERSPLQYILGQKSLRWAWYCLLGLSLFYIAFRAKRRQRIIPVIEENKNTSLEFVATIGKLYRQQGNHKKLCQDKMRLFLANIRERYGLATNSLDEDFYKRLSIKSEVPLNDIQQLFLIYKNIENSSTLTDTTFLNFHQAVKNFMLQSR